MASRRIFGGASSIRAELGARSTKRGRKDFKPLGCATRHRFVRECAQIGLVRTAGCDGNITEISNSFQLHVYPLAGGGPVRRPPTGALRRPTLEGVARRTRCREANIVERRKRGVMVSEDRWYAVGCRTYSMGVPVVTTEGLCRLSQNFYVCPKGNCRGDPDNADPGAYMLAPFSAFVEVSMTQLRRPGGRGGSGPRKAQARRGDG